jgi:hypothetical protein
LTTLGWISLNDYSVKYGISPSTLRRRIRSNEIENQFRNGKYYLKDQAIYRYFRKGSEEPQSDAKSSTVISLPVLSVVNESDKTAANVVNNVQEKVEAPIVQSQQPPLFDNFLDSANKLMSELKGAYVTVLHEKEIQIMQLKEEISNLKTLIKILESENERLTTNMKESAPIDSWLDKSF